ncbi:MAG: hypothetical protein ACM3WV_04600 [Bacillota bacterium]
MKNIIKIAAIPLGTLFLFLTFTFNQWYFVSEETNARFLQDKNPARAVEIYTRLAKGKYMRNRMESPTFRRENLDFYRGFKRLARGYADKMYGDRKYHEAVKYYELALICSRMEGSLGEKTADQDRIKIRLAQSLVFSGEPGKALSILPKNSGGNIPLSQKKFARLAYGLNKLRAALDHKKRKRWQEAMDLIGQAELSIRSVLDEDQRFVPYYTEILTQIGLEKKEIGSHIITR